MERVGTRRKIQIETTKINMVRRLKPMHYKKEVRSVKFQQWPLEFICMLNVVEALPRNLGDTERAFGFIKELLTSTEITSTLLLDPG